MCENSALKNFPMSVGPNLLESPREFIKCYVLDTYLPGVSHCVVGIRVRFEARANHQAPRTGAIAVYHRSPGVASLHNRISL